MSGQAGPPIDGDGGVLQPPAPPGPLGPPAPLAPPPPPGPSAAGPAWPSAWTAGPPPAWPVPIPAPARAAGRSAFLALALVVAGTTWVLVAASAIQIGVTVASADGTAGGSTDPDSSVLLLLVAVLGVACVAAARAGGAWLQHVSTAAGTASMEQVLDAVPAPAAPGDPQEPSIQRTTGALAALVAIGLMVIGAGVGLWLLAADPIEARVSLLAILGGASLLVIAQGLLPSLVRAIDRRELLAAPPDALGRPAPIPARRSPAAGVLGVVVALVLVVAGGVGVGRVRPEDTACQAPEAWTCSSVTVAAVPGPGPGAPDRVSVGYVVRRAPAAAGAREVLVIAVGGPGSSGIDEAGWYGDSLPQSILDRYDVVLFDARGVGVTDARGCPTAFEAYAADETPDGARRFAEFVRP